MKRREFITLLGGAAAAWPLVARAQRAHGLSASARIAFLGAESASTNQHFFDAFREGMREHGTSTARTLLFWSDGRKAGASAFLNSLKS